MARQTAIVISWKERATNMKRNRIFGALGLALLLAALALVPALADGSVAITAGTLSVTDADVDFGTVPFSFADQNTAEVSSTWNVADGRGTTDGWRVMATAGNFVNGGNTITITNANQRLRVTVPGGTIICTAGACMVAATSGVPGYDYLGATAVRLVYMPNGGSASSWDFGPAFRLTVPGASLAGVYTSIWTVTALAAPS
jgi:hypothetical protein